MYGREIGIDCGRRTMSMTFGRPVMIPEQHVQLRLHFNVDEIVEAGPSPGSLGFSVFDHYSTRFFYATMYVRLKNSPKLRLL